MIPVIVAFFGESIVPESLVSTILDLVPFRPTNPYLILVYAVMLVYLPFGLSILYKAQITSGNVDNVNPRKQSEKLSATHPLYARLQGAEKNMQEGFLVFAPALLAAVQAGVPSDTVSLYATFWLVSRVVYVFIYAVQFNQALGALRSMTFVFSLATTTKLMYLAAAM